jgi:hypothetical protein
VIITRVAVGEIKAFINSCTHRGTRLLSEEGTRAPGRAFTALSMDGLMTLMAPSKTCRGTGIFHMFVRQPIRFSP